MGKFILELFIVQIVILSSISNAQYCADSSNIYTFVYSGNKYEIVKENKNWIDAAICAVERGGKLAEIDSQEEQDTLYYHLMNAGIVASNTVAPDGGGASYIWIGGNDIAVEGEWIWDGNNDGVGRQFWQGTSSGNPVGGLYYNWGNEPDNWNNQDGLGLAITNWPLGNSGQWNDIRHTNNLYYLIEYDNSTGLSQNNLNQTNPTEYILFQNYPNPFNPKTTITFTLPKDSKVSLSLFDILGLEVATIIDNEEKANAVHNVLFDASNLTSGIYFYRLTTDTYQETKKMILLR